MRFTFQPEEFLVEEILSDGTILELDKPFKREDKPGKFTHFVMQKRSWNTHQALEAIGHALHVPQSRFNFAGTKDRNATTVQLCSVFAVHPTRVLGAKVKDVMILGAWNASDKVRLGDLAGNRFTITLLPRNCGQAVDVHDLEERAEEMNGLVPNYFGEQRFGSLRQNNHHIGKLMLQGKFKEAVLNFLTYTDENEESASREARLKLEKDLDKDKGFAKALDYFPHYLKYERQIIAHLNVYTKDYIGAFRKLPRTLQLMFVHSYQSFLFNKLLAEREKSGKLFTAQKGDHYCYQNHAGFPDVEEVEVVKNAKAAASVSKKIIEGKAFLAGTILGSESKPNSQEKALLKKEKIDLKQFKLEGMPELASKGGTRALFVPLKEFHTVKDAPSTIRFSLPSGAYATVAVEQLLKN
ncbi:MAG TPA: tRNA pseudouridine(13) synthase TruD [Candidatus Norongarragalinales archaeon]|jgi:tRNA pseudouridine13 synthase|nr:tRNA pseudouridine(13) synthase TruD [Candidatus Norongarragalinales archaeon]